MRQLNGVYTQHSNRRHRRVGHLFQGRYKGILVEADEYLLELSRYIVLNPVRAGMVRRTEQWPWSSYRATLGLEPAPAWLAVDALLAHFGRQGKRARGLRCVCRRWRRPAECLGQLRGQIYLGRERFVQRMQQQAAAPADINIARAQRRSPPPSLEVIERAHAGRDEAMVAAWNTGAYSYAEIAGHFGVHFTTVGRVVRAARAAAGEGV